MSTDAALFAEGLRKRYGSFEALRGVSLEVRRGEIFGFLGPNGAGKTTTIRCLLDLIRPSAGTVRVLGFDPQRDALEVRRRTGYLPGDLRLDERRTGEEMLRALAAIRRDAVDWVWVRRIAERLDIDLSRPIRNLSKGNRQKVGVLQALMHRPALLLLDEPTSGLDPLIQHEVLTLLREARDAGATIFLSSHILSEVQAVTERVAIIRAGEVVEVAETSAFTTRAMRRAIVRFREPVEPAALSAVEGAQVIDATDPQTLHLEVSGEMDALIKALAKLPVRDFETVQPSLEEVFLSYYGDAQGEAGQKGAG